MVFGCGGIGLNIVQIASAIGAEVIAVDIVGEKLDWAKKMGAKAALNAEEFERIDKEIRKLTSGGADIGFEAIGNPEVQKPDIFFPTHRWALCSGRLFG